MVFNWCSKFVFPFSKFYNYSLKLVDHAYQCLVKPPVKENTRPVDLVLQSDIRAVDRSEFDHQVLTELPLLNPFGKNEMKPVDNCKKVSLLLLP